MIPLVITIFDLTFFAAYHFSFSFLLLVCTYFCCRDEMHYNEYNSSPTVDSLDSPFLFGFNFKFFWFVLFLEGQKSVPFSPSRPF